MASAVELSPFSLWTRIGDDGLPPIAQVFARNGVPVGRVVYWTEGSEAQLVERWQAENISAVELGPVRDGLFAALLDLAGSLD